jgi:capsular exopolysaccharide synthesis family protein
MKSVEKSIGILDTKSERLAARRKRAAVDERASSSGGQNRAAPSAQPANVGFKERELPGDSSGQVTPVRPENPGTPENRSRSSEHAKSRYGQVNPHLVCLLDPRSEHAETYYRLRHQLEIRRQTDSALVVGVTSASPGDGKSLTAINLAGALARGADSRILLLDLNLRRTGEGVAEYLGMDVSRDWGVVNWFHQEEEGLEPFTHYLEPFNLHVMTAGSDPELPYELLKSRRLDELLRQAREDYDFVIVDTPQILRLPDTELISRLVDGFLVVVKAGHTRQARLEEALSLMTEEQVLGLVFNAVSKGS